MDPDLTIRIRIPDWRERLTGVERLLAAYVSAVEAGDTDAEMGLPDARVIEALAVVRSVLRVP